MAEGHQHEQYPTTGSTLEPVPLQPNGVDEEAPRREGQLEGPTTESEYELDQQQRYLRQHNLPLEVDRIVSQVLEATPKDPLAALEKAFRVRSKYPQGRPES